MLIQSIVNLLEAAAASSSSKNITGNIKQFDELMTRENLKRLEESYDGLFAFLAFHPSIDKAVASYVRADSAVAEDSGRHILIFFFLDTAAYRPKVLREDAFSRWIDFDFGNNPSYNLTTSLFAGATPPRMPGVLFVEKLSGPAEPVFVTLEGLTTAEAAAEKFRRLFQLVTESYLKRTWGEADGFASHLSRSLALNNYDYRRGDKTEMREWLVKSLAYLRQHAGDIVSAVKLFK